MARGQFAGSLLKNVLISFSSADTAVHLHVLMMFSRSRKSTGEYYLYQARGERICIHLTMFAKDDEFIKCKFY